MMGGCSSIEALAGRTPVHWASWPDHCAPAVQGIASAGRTIRARSCRQFAVTAHGTTRRPAGDHVLLLFSDSARTARPLPGASFRVDGTGLPADGGGGEVCVPAAVQGAGRAVVGLRPARHNSGPARR